MTTPVMDHDNPEGNRSLCKAGARARAYCHPHVIVACMSIELNYTLKMKIHNTAELQPANREGQIVKITRSIRSEKHLGSKRNI